MARPTRRVDSSDDELGDVSAQTVDSEDELSIIKATRKRSAPSSRSSRARVTDSDDEEVDDDEQLPAAKKKAVEDSRPGRMLMVAVESMLKVSLHCFGYDQVLDRHEYQCSPRYFTVLEKASSKSYHAVVNGQLFRFISSFR